MKLAIYLFLLIIGSNVHSQTINLNQLLKWRETNYKFVEKELLKMSWEKIPAQNSDDIYITNGYYLNRLSRNEKGLTLTNTNDYKIENNNISYNSVKDENYDNFVNQIKSSNYKLFESKKSENAISDYYRSDKITIIISILKSVDDQLREIQFFTISLSTNDDYQKSHKE